MKDQTIFEALEKLGAAFPWEEVNLWICRQPEGVMSYVVYLKGNYDFGLAPHSCSGPTLEEAVERALKEFSDKRDPERSRLKKIRELELQLARLKAKGPLSLPPFRPCLLLGVSNPAPERPPEPPAFINVDSTRDDVPF